MDFDLSEDQLALRDGARELLDDRASSTKVRTHTAGDEPFDRALWLSMVEQGWPAIEVPEARGGVGLGTVEACVLTEEMGRHAAPAPFVAQMLALDAFAFAGADAWCDRLLAGDALTRFLGAIGDSHQLDAGLGAELRNVMVSSVGAGTHESHADLLAGHGARW